VFLSAQPAPGEVSISSVDVTDDSGDNVARYGEPNEVSVVLENTGGLVASNVISSVSTLVAGFTITPDAGNVAVNLSAGESVTNLFSIVAATSVPFGSAGFTCIGTADGSSATNTFDIVVGNGITVSGAQPGNLVSLAVGASGATDTGSLTVTNISYLPVTCTMTTTEPWLSVPSPVVVPANGTGTIDLTADSAGLADGYYEDAMTVAYSQPVAAGIGSYTVGFNVGPRIAILGVETTFLQDNGVIPGGLSTIEPGDILQIVVTNMNDSPLAISNATTSLTARNSAGFTIVPQTPESFSVLVPYVPVTTTYEVTVNQAVEDGAELFDITTRRD
jgi:hypothetical protein